MRMFGIPYFLVYLWVAMGCKSPASTSSTAGTQSGRYSEDLSELRPKVKVETETPVQPANTVDRKNTTYVEPKYAVNQKLDAVLDSIDRINIARKFVDGFTIQVFSGKREDALNTRKQLTSLMPEISSEVQFTEPIFRVKAGKYYSWIDAQSDFSMIKKYFPAAILIPDKIAVAQ